MIETEILRAELERLFELDELLKLSRELLGFDPETIGGTAAIASFAGALTAHCMEHDAIEALCDALVATKPEVNSKIDGLRITGLIFDEELKPGSELHPFTIVRKLGEGRLAISYVARKGDAEFRLKVLRRESTRDQRGLHRYLTINRLIGTVDHPGLPKRLSAGEFGDRYCVVHEHVEGQPLAARILRTGPMHLNEARPILRGVLEALQALHQRRIAHGDLRLENVIIVRSGDVQSVVLVDAGSDRLRARARLGNGRTELFSTTGSPKTVSPEQIRGNFTDPQSDVYSFGAMLFEVLTGKPVFGEKNALEAAFGHLSEEPKLPSSVAPRGWITREIDEFVLSLLQKDPAKRPKDAKAVLDQLDALAGGAQERISISDEDLREKLEKLAADPRNEELAIEIEAAAEADGNASRIGDAFDTAAAALPDEGEDAELKKSLLFRAARVFTAAKNLEKAEATYLKLFEVDADDPVALTGLEEIRKRLGKYEDVIEMLLERSERAESPEERARAFSEIGRLYASELDDKEQALVALTQAFCADPKQSALASEIERLAGTGADAWNEVLSSCAETLASDELSAEAKTPLLLRTGRWYVEKLQRPDLALPCFQAVLEFEPSSDAALEGLTQIYRKAQQWGELGAVLTRRADASASPVQARNLRAEAAELLERYLNDTTRAQALYEQILAEDPGHVKASDALAKLLEKSSDFHELVKLLERRAEAQRGEEKLRTLCRIAEVYETQLSDNGEAEKRYSAVLAEDAHNLDALRGLDRLYAKSGQFQNLLDNLERQLEGAATPRQKVTLLERVAAIHEEEFLNRELAAKTLERIIELDAANENALTGLVRLYRALERFEDVERSYERHIKLVSETPRKLALILARAKVLAQNIGSPERAMKAYQQALEIEPQHPGALEALAHLQESMGDSDAALAAIETLAQKATTPDGKAEQYLRAAKLLEARGDRDGAIERYKLALDANPKDANVASALRAAYVARGDVNSALQLLEKQLEQTEGELAKAKLTGQMAVLCRTKLGDDKRAEEAAKRALGYDPTNLDALIVSADVAFESKRPVEAAKHYEFVAARVETLEKSEAIRVLVRYVDSLSQTGSTEKALAVMDVLLRLAPDDADALARVAQVTLENGDAERAINIYKDLLERFDSKLSPGERKTVHYGYGDALRKSGKFEAAIKVLEEATDLDASNSEPLIALAKIYEAQEKWDQVIKVKTRHLDLAQDDERVQLLVDIGDIAAAKLNDRAQAAKSFLAALDERPDDRRLLNKLMQLYSEDKDWNKLVEVVLRLADFVDDPKQKVKYLHTAAIVTARQIGDFDRALGFYEQVLELEPDFEKAIDECIALEQDRGKFEAVETWLKKKLHLATERNDESAMLATFVALGELYEKNLGWTEQAIDAFEAAQTLDPDNRERTEHLSNLYATDPARYLDKAISAQSALLRQNPYRHESYKTLRRMYTETKHADASWCLCQALTVLNLAEPDEERFYKRMRSDTAAPAQEVLTEEDWLERLMHPDADPLLTAVFALIEPAVIARRSNTFEELGYNQSLLVDVTTHSAPVCQSLFYAAGVLGMPLPPTFVNPNDQGGLSFLFTHDPSIVLGVTALRSDVPLQPAAFIAARHLTYLRPGLYLRHLLASGTALKAWLFAAIKLIAPQFPVTPELEGAVNEAHQALDAGLQGQARDQLTRVVSKLLQSGAALDLKRWVAGVDLTADRVGFLAAHDLETAASILRASDESASAVPEEERFKELVLFSVSPEYFDLRKRLMIAVDS